MRLFIATTFPEEILRPLNARLTALRPRLPHASWVRPETQHLTFAFLGDQDESVVEKIHINGSEAFEAFLQGCGFFPNRRNARVGWVGAEPQERFCAIATSVRDGVRKAGVAFEESEFRPHLTLMRIRDRWPPLAAETFEKGLGDYRSAPFAVDHITLFFSQLSSKGAIHTPLRKFSLGLSA